MLNFSTDCLIANTEMYFKVIDATQLQLYDRSWLRELAYGHNRNRHNDKELYQSNSKF